MTEIGAQAAEGSVAPSNSSSRRETLAAGGSLLGAIAASSCCILPLVLFSLGVTGAWMGNLVALEPYQPLFVAVTIGFLGYGYYLAFWRPRTVCAADGACARAAPSRLVKTALVVATVLVAAAVGFPYAAPALLGV